MRLRGTWDTRAGNRTIMASCVFLLFNECAKNSEVDSARGGTWFERARLAERINAGDDSDSVWDSAD
jgi:hypothetical protein